MPLDRNSPIFTPAVPVVSLTPEIDIHGNPITVGTKVRSFSFPFVFDDGNVAGFGMNDERTSYYEGTVLAIGDRTIDGCRRYTIQVASSHRARNGKIEVETIVETGEDGQLFPPLNGTPILGGDRCCGVVVVVDNA